MGVHFSIDVEARLVSYVVEGLITTDHARAFFATVLVHPDFEPGFHFLGDRREVTDEPDSSYIRAVSLEVLARQAVLGPCRWAVLVATDISYGMARMWGLLTHSSGVEIRPFLRAGGSPALAGPAGGLRAALFRGGMRGLKRIARLGVLMGFARNDDTSPAGPTGSRPIVSYGALPTPCRNQLIAP
jgi:hypothetical protein